MGDETEEPKWRDGISGVNGLWMANTEPEERVTRPVAGTALVSPAEMNHPGRKGETGWAALTTLIDLSTGSQNTLCEEPSARVRLHLRSFRKRESKRTLHINLHTTPSRVHRAVLGRLLWFGMVDREQESRK